MIACAPAPHPHDACARDGVRSPSSSSVWALLGAAGLYVDFHVVADRRNECGHAPRRPAHRPRRPQLRDGLSGSSLPKARAKLEGKLDRAGDTTHLEASCDNAGGGIEQCDVRACEAHMRKTLRIEEQGRPELAVEKRGLRANGLRAGGDGQPTLGGICAVDIERATRVLEAALNSADAPPRYLEGNSEAAAIKVNRLRAGPRTTQRQADKGRHPDHCGGAHCCAAALGLGPHD